MKYNRELKAIDTQEKAYLLGQIYGDGNNNCRPRGFRVMLASINTDKDLYEQLVKKFPFFKTTTMPSHPNIIYMVCMEKQLCLDLLELGMSSPKTPKDETGEFHFPNLKEDLIPHFIRGYFDADGAVYLPKRVRSRNNLRIEFGCSTPNFLRRIQEELRKVGIEFTWYERDKKAGNGKYYHSYTISSSNQETSKRFADFIYKDATIYLDRKKNMCYTEPVYRPAANSLYGNCPHCNSKNIVRAVIRTGKRRLRCKDCGKRFTRPLPK